MRKHFLILMLMSLLPFAAWADDFSGATVVVQDITYGNVIPTGVGEATAPSAHGLTVTVSFGPQYVEASKFEIGEEYFSDENLTQSAGTDLTTLPYSENAYYVKITAIPGQGHTGFKVGKFFVKKAKLTITYDESTKPLEKNYGVATDPALDKTKITITGWKNGEGTVTVNGTTSDSELATSVKNSLSYTYADGTKNVVKDANWDVTENKWFNYESTEKPGSGYELKWTATELNNYEFEKPTNTMKVKQIQLATNNKFTFDSDKLEYEYKGTAQLPLYTITYKNAQNETINLALAKTVNNVTTGDYEVEYKWQAISADPTSEGFANGFIDEPTEGNNAHAVKNAWAGYYTATITGRAKGNFYGSVNFPAKFKNDKNYYVIKQKDLYFGAQDVTKIYDAKAFTETSGVVNDIKFSPYGLAAADNTPTNIAAIQATVKAQRVTGMPAFTAKVGKWEIEPKVSDTDWNNLAAVITNNYKHKSAKDIIGFMIIKPRPVTVTANDLTDYIGRSLTNFGTLAIQNTNAEETTYYTNYVAVEANGTDKGVALETSASGYSDEIQDILGGFNLEFTESHTVRGSWPGIIKVTPKSTDPEAADYYTGNYKIIAGENADYTIVGRSWGIFAKNNLVEVADYSNIPEGAVIYGDEITPDMLFGVAGLGDETFNTDALKFIIKPYNTTTLEEGDAVELSEDGLLNAGTYNVYIDPACAADIVAPGEYEAPSIDVNAARLVVNKKKIYAIPAPATLSVYSATTPGNTLADLNIVGRHLVKFLESNALTNGQYTADNGLVGDDQLSFMLDFTNDNKVTVSTSGANKGQITAIADGATISVVMIDALPASTAATYPYYVTDNANGNYLVDVTTTAPLTNGGAILALNRTDANLLSQLAAANGKKYTVRMSGYTAEQTLKAGKWYSVVLPFQISVAKLSATMKPVSTANDLNPDGYAIVNVINETKTTKDAVHFKLEMSSIPANIPFLVKPATDVVLNYKDANATGSAQVGDNFVEFKDVTIVAPNVNPNGSVEKNVNDVIFYGVYKRDTTLPAGASFYAGQFYTTDAANSTMNAFASYWTANAGARVFVEDLDANGTTVIREVNTESMTNIATTGWYTLNGVKLQSVPTEKGIYILNGKKVVIK